MGWGKLSIAALSLVFSLTASGAEPSGRYKTVVDRMNALQAQFPERVGVFSIGQNDDGVEIYAMRISTSPRYSDTAKVAHFIVSTHHGNEQKATTFTMHFVDELLKKYLSPEVYRGNLADTEWTVIPVLNVSGYNSNNRYEKGVDSNRDYPGICSGAPGGRLKSIRLIMEHLKTRVYSGSLTVHGYIGTLTYPWGVNVDNPRTHDHNHFAQITAKAASHNGYRHGTSTDIVYPAEGTYEDYAYLKHGMWSLLLELKDGSADDIRKTTTAMMAYFDQLDASPSTKNQFTARCLRNNKGRAYRLE